MAEPTQDDGAPPAATSTTPPPPPPRRLSRRVRVAIVVGALFVAWTAFGFLIAPGILRGVIVEQASVALKREATVAKVRVNPLALSLTIDGFRVKHRDGTPFLGWDSLYVRLAPLRLLVGDVGFAQIRLVRPSVAVGLAANGSLTFQDLLGGEEKAAEAPPPKAEAGGVTIAIGR